MVRSPILALQRDWLVAAQMALVLISCTASCTARTGFREPSDFDHFGRATTRVGTADSSGDSETAGDAGPVGDNGWAYPGDGLNTGDTIIGGDGLVLPQFDWGGLTWEIVTGDAPDWDADAALLQAPNCGRAEAQAVDFEMQDGAVAVDDRVDEMCGRAQALLYVRVESLAPCEQSRALGCAIDLQTKNLYVAVWDNACISHNYGAASAPMVEVGQWYRMTARVAGSVLECELTGPGLDVPLTVSRTDTADPPIVQGTIAVGSDSAAVTFAALSVSSP